MNYATKSKDVNSDQQHKAVISTHITDCKRSQSEHVYMTKKTVYHHVKAHGKTLICNCRKQEIQ